MCGPLSLARRPFSFIETPSGLLWSVALRVRTILSASGPFSIACVGHAVIILSNVRTSARRVRTFFVLVDLLYVMVNFPLSLADRFYSSGPRVDFFVLLRFTILSASGAFSIACLANVDSILSNVRTSASRVRTFFIIVDLFYVTGGLMSLDRDRFNSSGLRVTFSGHSRFACGPFSPRVDLFLLLA